MPFLTTEVGVEMIPDIVPTLEPVPSKVKAKAPVPTVPLKVRIPEVVAVIVAPDEPKVIGPLKEASLPVLVNAPAAKAVKPVPFKVSGSAVERVNPFKSRTAPEVTEVIPAIVPKAETLPSFKVPTLTVVVPE